MAPTRPVAEPLSLGTADDATMIEFAMMTPLERPTKIIGTANPIGDEGLFMCQISMMMRLVSDAAAPTDVMTSIDNV